MKRAAALFVLAGTALGVWGWRANLGSPAPPTVQPPAAPRLAAAPQPLEAPAAARNVPAADAPCRPVPSTARLLGARLLGRGSPKPVTATLFPPDTGAKHTVYLGERSLGSTRDFTLLTPVDLGTFALGRELDFSLRVGSSRRTYRTGPADRNPDRRHHAGVIPLGDAWMLGFEDTEGGGDGDFDDAVVMVRGEVAAEAGGILWCLPRKGPAQ